MSRRISSGGERRSGRRQGLKRGTLGAPVARWWLPMLFLLLCSSPTTGQEPLGGSSFFLSEGSALRQALSRNLAIAQSGGWPALPQGETLRTGMSGPAVERLRLRLSISGDLPPEADKGDRFDAETEAAVKRFQARHGLTQDGVVGAKTRSALNTPVEERVRQIKINLERVSRLPQDTEDRFLLVNVPDFSLGAFRDGRRVLEMKVIVGRPKRPTPSLCERVTHIVFNPDWNVPHRIAARDILPKILKDPRHLTAQGFRVYGGQTAGGTEMDIEGIDWPSLAGHFPYRLRQDPGPQNALGRVKFFLPNPFDIYLHDTPERTLFARTRRAFSSGCIRVEKPLELAAFLLADEPAWSPDAVHAAIGSGKTRWLRLSDPVPIYVVYWTAWVDPDGTVQFRDDLYDRDGRSGDGVANDPVSQSPPRPAASASAPRGRNPTSGQPQSTGSGVGG
jgi:murein L,D-transpeptidase YcbB/YkuD